MMTVRPRILAIGIVAAALLAWPLAADPHILALATRIVIYGMLALSLDLILGYAGLVSLGHAAFFGVGAYALGILLTNGIGSGFVVFPAAILCSALVALLIGSLVLRTREIYFIMLTLAFAQMIFYLAVGQPQYGGDDGMPLPRRPDFAGLIDTGDPAQFYCLTVALAMGVLYLTWRLVNSRFGLVLSACRQNERRLLTVGVSPYRYQLAMFVIAGAIAGLAGALNATLQAYVSPNYLGWNISGVLIMMVVIGGIGTLFGPLIGAAIYIALEELITPYTTHWMAILGPILVLAALFWRNGLWGLVMRSEAACPVTPPEPVWLRIRRSLRAR